jgi:hypothetical protein
MFGGTVLMTAMAAMLSACSDSHAPTGEDAPAQKSQAKLPDGFIVAEAPEGAIGVAQARDVEAGKEVVVRGRVGGVADPISSGHALMVLADTDNIDYCGADGVDDHCPKPWDYCCTPQEDKLANTLSVQVKDESGNVVPGTLRGVGGIEPLSVVVVRGSVERPSEKSVIVNARELYVEDESR